MFLSDNETRLDLLNNRLIADSVVSLIREEPHRPISIGVHGDWGAGKSSILLMVEEAFQEDDSVVCLTFNGWLFQGFEDAKVVLIEHIVQGLEDAKPRSKKVKQAAKDVLRRVDWLRAARRAGGLAWTAFAGVPDPALLSDLGTILGKLKENPKELAEGAGEVVSKLSPLLKDPEPRHLPKEIHDFRDEFEKLLEAAEVSRLVVLIDDLDRCLPNAAIETLEAIRLFLWMPRSAFVVGADEAMIEYAVQEHFPDLPPSTGPLSYSRNYLEKLIQVPFRIPVLGEQETRVYVTLLLLLAELGPDDDRFNRILELARTALNRPWESSGLERSQIEEALGKESVSPGMQEAITLSAQLGRALARGASGNPRQIKRFLNSWLLRYDVAQQRGFGEMVKRDLLAKVVLAERFIPTLFDRLATEASEASDGRSPSLEQLEALDPNSDDQDLPEWLRRDERSREWAQIEPPLAEVDLRPYIFITRDRRGRLSLPGAGDPLHELASRLSGPEMAVLTHEDEVRNLPSDQARGMFHLLRETVLQTEDLSGKPDGAAGLVLLAKHHPELRPLLLDLLGDLPEQRLGPWVVAGWAELFDGELHTRFQDLLARWAENEDNSALRAAAGAARQMH